MENKNYEATIIEGNAEMSAKEKLNFLNLSDAKSLDELTKEGGSYEIQKVESYARVAVHNEKAENKDYEVLVIVDSEGNRFRTGSLAFYNSFMEIYEAMTDAGEDFGLKCYRVPSKNYQGRDFLSCSVI